MSLTLTISISVPSAITAGGFIYARQKGVDFFRIVRRFPQSRETLPKHSYNLSPEQLTVLQAIYDAFKNDGKWPLFDSIDRKLYSEQHYNVSAIVASLPADLLIPVSTPTMQPRRSETLRLTVEGLSLCVGSSDDIQHFLSALEWLVKREEAFIPRRDEIDRGMPVTAEELADELELKRNSNALRRLILLLGVERWGAQAEIGSFDDGWTCWVGPQIRDFRDVHKLEDYMAVKEVWKSGAI